MWDPLDVAVVTDAGMKSLIVATREYRVTNTIYTAMIGIGICVFAGEDLIDFEDVKEIIVLNRQAQSSYVFECSQFVCKWVMEHHGHARNFQILSRAHLCSANQAVRPVPVKDRNMKGTSKCCFYRRASAHP